MIAIEELILFMKKGWVAMDEDGDWNWYDHTPFKINIGWVSSEHGIHAYSLRCFDIKPVEDWKTSLRKVG